MAEGYKITGQLPTSAVGPTGTYVPSIQVSFETKPSGIIGHVTLPVSAYTVDAVAKAVSESAALLEQVQAL